MKLTKIFNPEIFAKASLSIMLIALPFDNAVFHLGTLILWVGAFLVSRQPAGPNFGSTIAAQKNVHWAFLSIVVIMVASNLLGLLLSLAIRRLVRLESSSTSLIVEVGKEKKATSAPETNAEPTNNVKSKATRASVSTSGPSAPSTNTEANTLKKTSFN